MNLSSLYKLTLGLTPRLMLIFFSIVFHLYSTNSLAETCKLSESPQTDFVMPKTIYIAPDSTVGKLFGSPVRKTYTFDCSGALSSNQNAEGHISLRWRERSDKIDIAPNRYIIPTNVQGIGVVISIQVNEDGMSSPLTSIGKLGGSILKFRNTKGNVATPLKKQAHISAQFIQTAPTIMNSDANINDIQALPLFDLNWINSLNLQINPIKTNISTIGTTQIQLSSCSIQGSTIRTVILPEIYPFELKGVGTFSTKGKKFSIKLDCHTNTDIYITLSSAQVSPLLATVLEPQKTPDAAEGVGIQLRMNDANGDLITFDQKQLIPLKKQKSGVRTLRFYANYFQTKTEIKPGIINATATFVIEYQ